MAQWKNWVKVQKLSTSYTNHCVRSSVITNLNDEGFKARDIMATTGHKFESSIRSYAKKVSTKHRREVSDALALKIIGKEPRSKKKAISSTVSSAPKDETSATNEASMIDFELFPDFEDDDLVRVLTEIENENNNITAVTSDDQQLKKINWQCKVKMNQKLSISHQMSRTYQPSAAHQYYHTIFTVTINYNFNKYKITESKKK